MDVEYVKRELSLHELTDQELPQEIKESLNLIRGYFDHMMASDGKSEFWEDKNYKDTYRVISGALIHRTKLSKAKYDHIQDTLGFTEAPFDVDAIDGIIKVLTEYYLEKNSNRFKDTLIYKHINNYEKIERYPTRFAEMMGGISTRIIGGKL